jgi:diacylglycerol kinase (ATP)
MSENKKVFFIINKFSGPGYRPDVEGKIIETCDKLDLECTIEFTRERGHATELAQQAVSQHFPVVFAVGGDGTVNEVAQGLVFSKSVMGILPKGSGNGLARHLNIPVNFLRSLQTIASKKTIAMDTILVNGKLSVNIAGIGFDGYVASLFGKDGKRGFIGYSKLVLREFNRFEEFPVKVEVDGSSLNRTAFILALANSSQFGNNVRVAPQASVCDSLIDVCLIRKAPLLRTFGIARRMFDGSFDRSDFVEIIKAQKIHLEFEQAQAFHIDGEPMDPQQHFSVEMQAGSLHMLVPDKISSKI